jgi:hypothetical protein
MIGWNTAVGHFDESVNQGPMMQQMWHIKEASLLKALVLSLQVGFNLQPCHW